MSLSAERSPASFPNSNSGSSIEAAPLEVQAATGSFQGANTGSRDRGYVYLPTLDTLKEVDAWSHTELLRRGRFIYNSGGGLIHRGVNGIARMVCGTGLFPYPLSKNKEWSDRVRRLWMQRCETAATFDLSRKFTCGAAQQALVRAKIRDGDLAPVLAREKGGRLRVMFYEAHQVGSGTRTTPSGERWHHGVRLDQYHAPVAYRILPSSLDQGGVPVDVPAQNVLFCANYERFGQVRGLSRFYPVINKVLDRGEIMAALTKGIKQRAQIGWAVEQEMGQNQPITPGAPGSGALNLLPQTKVDAGNGRVLTMEQFFGGGEGRELKPGQKIKTVESAHPHENVREHLENLVRDVAWALGYSPEILWNITQLGGANTRFIMADAQSQIETEQQEMVEQFLGPWYLAWVRDMIEAGEIPDVPDWQMHTWLLPKRLTVDFGRDGKLHIEQAKRGMITLKSLYGFTGDEWQIEVDQYLDERKYIKDGLNTRGLSWQEAYPEITTAPGGTGDVASASNEADATTAMAEQIEEIHAAITQAADTPPHR